MQNEEFKIGFLQIAKAWMDPGKVNSEMITRYWEFLKEFRNDTFLKAIDFIIDLPVQRIPPPATMQRICKDIEHRTYPDNEFSADINELIRGEIMDEISHLESLPANQMTVRRQDKLQKLKNRLERMRWQSR